MKKKVKFEDVCRAQNHIQTALSLLRGVAKADGGRGKRLNRGLLDALDELSGPSSELHSLSDWAVALEEEWKEDDDQTFWLESAEVVEVTQATGIILRQRQQVETLEYSLCWDYPDEPGSGFAFPCDKDGLVNATLLTKTSLQKLTELYADPGDLIYRGVESRINSFWEDALGRCECGSLVLLEDAIYNRCEKCGRFYNQVGQELSDPSTWGEETGETPSDILIERHHFGWDQ